MTRTALSVVFVLLACAASAAGQTVFVVRHAERADTVSGGPAMMAADPELSDAGRARAQSLAAMLKDAGVTSIFTTQFKRTKQTAEPLAKAAGVTPVEVNSKDLATLAQQVKAAPGNVLVVGHSNTVPGLLKDLGITTAYEIADTEYDNLFVVTLGEKPSAARLRYK